MKVQKRDGGDERRILLGMIADHDVCGRVAAKWAGDGLFASRHANLIGKWCVKHYERYGKPPRDAIESAFARWHEKGGDDATADLIHELLSGLSGEYERIGEEINSEYVCDVAGRHFSRVALSKLRDKLDADLDAGDVDKAYDRVSAFGRVDVGASESVDVFNDEAALRRAFEHSTDVLIKFPGALGEFFGASLERDGFVAAMGKAKGGKSFWCQELAWRAVMQRRRVAYFQAGDLSERQQMKRFAVRASGRPWYPTKEGKPVLFPVKLKRREGKPISIRHEEREYADALTFEFARDAVRKLREKKLGDGEAAFRLSCHPSYSLTVGAIETQLRQWDRAGWSPDVVVIDYADILAPTPGIREARDAINDVWVRLRGLSQRYHCLVFTVTQANADAITAENVSRKHFANDRRKYDHVTGMFAISQSDEDKSAGVSRLGWVVLRESDFSERHQVRVAGCRAIGREAVLSCW